MRAYRTPAGFTLIELVVCGAIAGMVFAIAGPALDKGRAGVDQRRCQNNLRQLSIAMHSYANANGGLPPMAIAWPGVSNGPPGPGGWYDNHSWYSMIAPYIGEPQWAATVDLTVSMSHQNNLAARRGGLRLKVHACPADIGLQPMEWHTTNWSRVLSNYVVNAGNTNYGQTELNGVPFLGAPFAGGLITPLGTITDGLSNTLMVSEVFVLQRSAVWGGAYSEIQLSVGGQVFTGYNPPNSTNVHDGIGYGRNGHQTSLAANARYVAAGFTPENWPISAGSSPLSSTYIAPRSKHPGGFNASLCDGSAGFIANGIDLTVWRALSTARGGEVLPSARSAPPRR